MEGQSNQYLSNNYSQSNLSRIDEDKLFDSDVSSINNKKIKSIARHEDAKKLLKDEKGVQLAS